ncbi:hypothetical protein [Kaistia algarum]|uniref:hypothetical protein n=1 Tax=Kaistia algarum TaxID=2083279 RepID=UPI0010573B41|nr:hypothetical protein [Kaistia algarum]MCX5512163.1 hypothetical protein [Kaistia algarum]
MRVSNVIASPKVVTDWGKWTNDQMGKHVFPLTKRRGACLRYGASHRWRLIRFEALGASFRILAAYRQDIDEFKAHLALEHASDMTVLCSWEYHGTHPGWHIHVNCDEVSKITPGLARPPGVRLPGGRSIHRQQNFAGTSSPMSDNAALTVIQKRFRLDPPDLLSFRARP